VGSAGGDKVEALKLVGAEDDGVGEGMTFEDKTPARAYGQMSTSPIKKPRYWILIVLSIAVSWGFIGLVVVRAVSRGTKDANVAIEQLHARMGRQDWSGLYAGADQRYRSATTAEESNALFVGITKKLGTPVHTKQLGTQIQTTPSGKYLVSSFQTEFSLHETGTERVTWREFNGTYRLVGYNVRSTALLAH
jgi:hypothetical protein